MTRTSVACRGALTLRAWALEALSRAGETAAPGDAATVPPPAVPESALYTFLERERCAAALLGPMGGTTGAGLGLVRARAFHEGSRGLAARGQLHRLDVALAGRGVEAVVLKGGAAVALGQTVDLADLDILVEPSRAAEVAALLESSEGLAPVGRDPRVDDRARAHLAPRFTAGSIAVEVHFDIRYLDHVETARRSAVPIPGFRALRRLAPADHLRHLVVHATIHHPERRGRLRDLLLVRDAVRACSAEQLREARRHLESYAAVPAVEAMLTMAVTLAEGRAPDDAFADTAAAAYLVLARGAVRRATNRRLLVLRSAIALVHGDGEYGRLVRRVVRPNDCPSRRRWLAGLQNAWPALGRAVRVLGLTSLTGLALVPAANIASRARRLARARRHSG